MRDCQDSYVAEVDLTYGGESYTSTPLFVKCAMRSHVRQIEKVARVSGTIDANYLHLRNKFAARTRSPVTGFPVEGHISQLKRRSSEGYRSWIPSDLNTSLDITFDRLALSERLNT